MKGAGGSDDRQGDCFGQSCDPYLGSCYLLRDGAHTATVMFFSVLLLVLVSNQSRMAALLLTPVDKHGLSVSSLSGIKDFWVVQIQESVPVHVDPCTLEERKKRLGHVT